MAESFQTGSVDTYRDEVESGEQDVVFKPPVTRRGPGGQGLPSGTGVPRLGGLPRGHGPRQRQPGRFSELAPNPLDTAVELRDLRFAYPALMRSEAGASPLTGWVYVNQQNGIDAMVMGGRVQK